MTYTLTRAALRNLVADLARPAEAASVALVRFDERLAGQGRHPGGAALADGVRARAHMLEAQALAQLGGEMASLEDLVLHEAGMDARAPGVGTLRAAAILAERRRLARRAPDAVLAAEAVRRLIGVASDDEKDDDEKADEDQRPAGAAAPAIGPRGWEMPRPTGDDGGDAIWAEQEGQEQEQGNGPGEGYADDAGFDAGDAGSGAEQGLGEFAVLDALLARTRRSLAAFNGPVPGAAPLRLRDPGQGGAERLGAWAAVLDETRRLPGALAAALALDAWLTLEPADRNGEAGWTLAATVLRQRGLAERHLPALGLAYRKGRFRWGPRQALERRVEGLLAVIAGSARLAQADLQRLQLARQVMALRCEGRRETSRLPQLVGLFLELPLVTTQLAARRLGVSPQAIEAMLRELGPSLPRELTGRKRYRAWGIV